MSKRVNNSVPKSTKKSGRPRGFEADDVLDAAVEVFWRKGYEGASLDDLTSAMGINRPSLYGAFGDKRTLFLQALDRYGTEIGNKPMEALCAEQDIKRAVTRFFEISLKNQTRKGDCAQGCMLATCGSATAETLPEARQKLMDALEMSQALLEQRFASEVELGNLPADFPVKERAILMLDLMQSQGYRARAGASTRSLASQISMRVATVLS